MASGRLNNMIEKDPLTKITRKPSKSSASRCQGIENPFEPYKNGSVSFLKIFTEYWVSAILQKGFQQRLIIGRAKIKGDFIASVKNIQGTSMIQVTFKTFLPSSGRTHPHYFMAYFLPTVCRTGVYCSIFS